MPKPRFIIRHRWALGDTVLMTALVRDIQRAYPGQYELQVDTNWTPIWWHNPHIVPPQPQRSSRPLLVNVGWGEAIKKNSRARTAQGYELKHILAWYHYDFERQTGIRVPVSDPRPELFLTAQENQRLIQGRYWVVFSGGKLDITNKHWWGERYQQVVNRLHDYGLRFVQCGGTHKQTVHPPLENALNMVGKTDNVRDLFNIIQHAEGVICPVTGAMHIAAAFEKPCVVLAGGREEPWFEWYGNGFEAFGPGALPVRVPHKFLHTLGQLHCCDKQGCWKQRTVPLAVADGGKQKKPSLCREPVRGTEQAVALCMDRITVDHVVEAVMEYYEAGILPPLGVPRGKYPDLGRNPPPQPVEVPLSEPEPMPQAASRQVQRANSSVLVPPPLIRIPQIELQPPPAEPTLIGTPQLVKTQRAHQQVYPTEAGRPAVKPLVRRNVLDHAIFDHPVIGGKFTVCVLCYGPYPELARRCLGSILEHIPPHRLDLRVAYNHSETKDPIEQAAEQETVQYLRSLPCTVTYINQKNRKKYPVMREMFWDPRHPLKTNYVLWFDDDTKIVDPLMLKYLVETIVANHNHGCRMFGTILTHDINMFAKDGNRPDTWFTGADWYRGVQFRLKNTERRAPNGSVIDFCTGWFWALATETIRQASIPDLRLGHNGGDVTIGAQVAQSGGKLKLFNKGKSLVWCPEKQDGGRRGYFERFPWAAVRAVK
jgi:hypothetical protein